MQLQGESPACLEMWLGHVHCARMSQNCSCPCQDRGRERETRRHTGCQRGPSCASRDCMSTECNFQLEFQLRECSQGVHNPLALAQSMPSSWAASVRASVGPPKLCKACLGIPGFSSSTAPEVRKSADSSGTDTPPRYTCTTTQRSFQFYVRQA